MFIGVDTHKDTLAASCVDHAGHQIAHQSFAEYPVGHAKLLTWPHDHAPELARIGIEGSANVGAGAAHFLYLHGIDVREVPAKLTGRERTRLRRPGKTDPTDALAIARIAARDHDLPPARRRGPHEELKVLVDAREELVTARTAEANRLHADLSILLPGYAGQVSSLVHPDAVTRAGKLVKPLDGARAGVARRRIVRLRRLDREISEMTAEIKQALAAVGTALTDIHGVGVITAARIIGEVGDISRFPSRAPFRRWQRHGTDPGRLRSDRSSPPEPRRQPAPQPRHPCHRTHPSRLASRSQDLHGQEARRGQDSRRSVTLPQASALRHRLPNTPRRSTPAPSRPTGDRSGHNCAVLITASCGARRRSQGCPKDTPKGPGLDSDEDDAILGNRDGSRTPSPTQLTQRLNGPSPPNAATCPKPA